MAGSVALFLNRNNTRGLASGLIRSATDPTPVGFPALVLGDDLSLSLKIVSDTGDGSLETLTGYSIKLGIGTAGARPTSGVWTLDDGTNTTANLNWNATNSEVETALNALGGGAGPFGDTVVALGSNGGPYKITWDTNGNVAQLDGTVDNLTPESGLTVVTVQEGSASAREIQTVQLFQQPVVLVSSWTISGTEATASVNLSDFDLIQSVIDAGGSQELVIEIEVTDAAGNIATMVQRPVKIFADVMPNGAGASSLNSATYATQAYVDGKVYLVKTDASDSTPNYLDTKLIETIEGVGGLLFMEKNYG